MTDPQIVIRVLAGKRPHIPPKVPKEFTNFIKKCLKNDPKERPSFQQLYRMLEVITVPKPNYETPIHIGEIQQNSNSTKHTDDTVPINRVSTPVRIPPGTVLGNSQSINIISPDEGSFSSPSSTIQIPIESLKEDIPIMRPSVFNETSAKREKINPGVEQEMIMFAASKGPSHHSYIVDKPEKELKKERISKSFTQPREHIQKPVQEKPTSSEKPDPPDHELNLQPTITNPRSSPPDLFSDIPPISPLSSLISDPIILPIGSKDPIPLDTSTQTQLQDIQLEDTSKLVPLPAESTVKNMADPSVVDIQSALPVKTNATTQTQLQTQSPS